ncbi:MAG: hypothetical protein HOD43_12805 [Candidatus Marinimicrobia bacterium]|jgi:hypothetical protein|nr:hypothetical protein [Candidatus Neomarinimicrobiota bacterium]MBT4993941.1 hypothetical protein [Candidatus Neomarinimicrobiota bacterium]MBT5313638.1 hypothetical protein [Candidatus Neomarinimicrobiota bacterium]MBT6719633.1 hypothetical protein [Candidatus Neomarinimicrobiota bacterium]
MSKDNSMEALFSAWSAEQQELDRIVSVKEGHVVINVGYEYSISLGTISSEKDVLDWAHHLCEKTWMTIPVLRRFIEVATSKSGLKLH